jgi:hypothetical protein
MASPRWCRGSESATMSGVRRGRKEGLWLVGLLVVSAICMMAASRFSERRRQENALLQCATNLNALATMFEDGDYSSDRIATDIESTIRSKLGRIPRCPLQPDVGYAYRVSSDRHSVVFCCFAHAGVHVDDPILYGGRLSGGGCLSGVDHVPPAKPVDARGLQFGPHGRLDLDITTFAAVNPSNSRL